MARSLGVSEMTIRRDLQTLHDEGVVMRTHGGALAREPARYDAEDSTFDARDRERQSAKAMIAAMAASRVGPGETIGIDVGTTMLALAEALAGRSDLKIVTNNLRAGLALGRSRSDICLLGGRLRRDELSVVGPIASQQLAAMSFDRVFIGVSGLVVEGGYDFAHEDTEVKRAFIERAGEVVVLCDAAKFDRHSLARVVSLDRIDVLITDRRPPAHLAQALDAADVETIIAASATAAIS